jgi:uncharacterized membrane protein
MLRIKIASLLTSLVAALAFFRAYYLVSFAAGYGIQQADRNQRLFLWGTIVCVLVFLGCALGIYLEAKRDH